jgi:hypothetical protein
LYPGIGSLWQEAHATYTIVRSEAPNLKMKMVKTEMTMKSFLELLEIGANTLYLQFFQLKLAICLILMCSWWRFHVACST